MLKSVDFFAEIFEEGALSLYSLKRVYELYAGIVVHNEISNSEPLYNQVRGTLFAETMREYLNLMNRKLKT